MYLCVDNRGRKKGLGEGGDIMETSKSCLCSQAATARLREKGEDNWQERVTTYLHTALLTG